MSDTTDTDDVRLVAVGSAERRTFTLPDYVPNDHLFVYFTAPDLRGLFHAVARWLTGR